MNYIHAIMTYKFIAICFLGVWLMTACGNPNVKNEDATAAQDTVTEVIDKPVLPDSVEGEFFGSVIKRKRGDYMAVLKELEDRKVLRVDSVAMDSDGFRYARVEFGGVMFGMNKGFRFISSCHSDRDYRRVVRHVERYYGKGSYDKECYNYQWPGYISPETDSLLHIRIRPLHSEEEGMVMMWRHF